MAKRIKKNRARYSISPNLITGIIIAGLILLFIIFVLPWLYANEPNTRSVIDSVTDSFSGSSRNPSLLLALVILIGFIISYIYRK